jgi:uncharacterized protein (DUF58 family)
VTGIRDALTTRGRAFLAAGLTLLVGGMLLGFTDITRVGVLLSALPLLAGFRARRSSNQVVVTRTVHPARLGVDQSAKVELIVRNTSGRKTQLQLAEEKVPYLLGDRPRFVLPPLDAGDIRRVDYQIRAHVRGRYRLGPLTMRQRDPYGLATMTTALPSSSDILVLPRVEPLGHGRPRAGGVGTEGSIPHMLALQGEDDVAVRSYRNGDDLRRIHWPSTAHRSELMVRQEDHPARRRAIVVLDSREAAHKGSGTMGSFEWAVTAAASFAAHLCEHQYTLHLASNETIEQGQATQAIDIDDALACLATARPGPSPRFDEVLRWAHPLASTGAMVLAIVTDLDEAALRKMAAMRQPEGTGLLILLDTASFAGPRPAEPTRRALAMTGIAVAAGWSTCVVTAGMTVAQAWNIVSADNPNNTAMVGAGP